VEGELLTAVQDTIGTALLCSSIQIRNAQLILESWDTGGTEKYKALAPLYCRGDRAAIVVLDITSPDSIEESEYGSARFAISGIRTRFLSGRPKRSVCRKGA
jgi:GTPase SAR1 family protein